MDYKDRVSKFKSTEANDQLDGELVENNHEQTVRDRFAVIQELIWQVVTPRFEEMRKALDESGYKAVITEGKGGPKDESPVYVTSLSMSFESPSKGSIAYEWEGYRFKITTYRGSDLEESHIGLDALDEQAVREQCDAFLEKMFPAG